MFKKTTSMPNVAESRSGARIARAQNLFADFIRTAKNELSKHPHELKKLEGYQTDILAAITANPLNIQRLGDNYSELLGLEAAYKATKPAVGSPYHTLGAELNKINGSLVSILRFDAMNSKFSSLTKDILKVEQNVQTIKKIDPKGEIVDTETIRATIEVLEKNLVSEEPNLRTADLAAKHLQKIIPVTTKESASHAHQSLAELRDNVNTIVGKVGILAQAPQVHVESASASQVGKRVLRTGNGPSRSGNVPPSRSCSIL